MVLLRVWFWICIMLPAVALAQQQVQVQYIAVDTPRAIPALPRKFQSNPAFQHYLQALPSRLVGMGYLAASVDSVSADTVNRKVWLYLGEKYRWQKLDYDSAAQYWLKEAGVANGKMKASGISPDSLQHVLLNTLAENGYPFAEVSWNDLAVSGQNISGQLRLNPGPLYKVDSLIQAGNLKLKPKFLYNYLNMRPGMPYDEGLPERADTRLAELPFATPVAPAELLMLGTGSLLKVNMQPRRANTFNLLLGLMPASTQTPDNKLQLTGDANLLLRNALGNGETIRANWQQIQYKSPRLNLAYEQLYLLGSKAGVDFQFELFKKDTQFLNLQTRIGIPYQVSLTQTGKLFYQYQQNSVTQMDTQFVKANKQLPDLADFTLSQLGLEWQWEGTDYRFNPRRGHSAWVQGMAGQKKINESNAIVNINDGSDFDYASLYDSIKLKSYQMRLRASYAQYFPLSSNLVMKASGNAGWLQSASYYRNELFQIGGYRLLRGFDEESIYARIYGVATAECRYLVGRNSFFFAFVDGGWAAYEDELQQYEHGYLGTGLGMNIETKNSQINLSWAIGKRSDLPLDFRQSKIHLGFVNFF